MPTIGPLELVLVLLVILIFFGVGRLPEVGSALGEAIREFRRGTRELEPPSKEESGSEKDEPS